MGDLPWSTRMGFLEFSLPMPNLANLLHGSGFYRIGWRSAAEAYERRDFAGKDTVLPPWPPPGTQPAPYDLMRTVRADMEPFLFECVGINGTTNSRLKNSWSSCHLA